MYYFWLQITLPLHLILRKRDSLNSPTPLEIGAPTRMGKVALLPTEHDQNHSTEAIILIRCHYIYQINQGFSFLLFLALSKCQLHTSPVEWMQRALYKRASSWRRKFSWKLKSTSSPALVTPFPHQNSNTNSRNQMQSWHYETLRMG